MKIKAIIFFSLINLFAFAQRGKDGAGNITIANSIVNIYTPLTANANAGNTTINVGSTAGFAIGDLVLIIQMQGANVNTTNGGATPPWFDAASSVPTDTSSGYITNYNNSGNYEFAQINSVLGANSFSFDCAIQKNYTSTGKVQVIKVPRYTTLTISGAGFITCPQWNGTTGGVAVVEVETNATLSSAPSFNVAGRGFRGGAVENASTLGGTKFGHISGTEGAYKGESIVGDTNTYKALASVFCRGAIANGGGGGSAHNAGGGGGANGGNVAAYRAYGNPTAGYNAAWNLEFAGFATFTSSGGGRGGYTFSSANLNPNTTAPGAGGWGGDNRRSMGGFGGRPLDYSTGRLFIGGGGGAGDSNDNYGAPAGNGGGMVYLLCYGNLSGTGTIMADGGNGGNTLLAGGCSGRDGASGGGGGGTVVLDILGTTNLTAAPAIFARGGGGGNVNFGAPCFNSEGYGPGAGGGGGYIAYTGALPLNAINGGTNGIVSGNSGQIRTNFPPNGATMGGGGSSNVIAPPKTVTATPSTTICVNNTATLFAGTNAAPATINWYSNSAGGSPIATGSPFTSSVMVTPGTYTVWASYCQNGTYRVPSIINVITGPTLTVNSASICNGQTATLTASGATTYTWNTGPTTNSITVNPVTTTIYTVSGTIASCSASATSTVTLLVAPVLAVNSATICSGQTATLTASGATTYTWNTGPTTNSITVNPVVNTTYTVTGSNGACTSTQTTNVVITAAPAVTSTSASICAGQTATLTAAGATSYTWNTGPTSNSITVSPGVTTNYTVIGSNGTCTNSAITTVSVVPSLVVTATSATICSGQSAILTAGGAASYTWSTAQTTNTISVSPIATSNYTVTGGSGSCTGSAIATVVVNANPTVTVNSVTICSGQTATLNAGGAATYTWNPGGFTGTSFTDSPVATQVYSLTGANANNCQSTITTTITVAVTPTISVASTTICAGQTATVIASGATNYTWTPTGITSATLTDTPGATTSYTVVGTNGNCNSIATATITIGSAIAITINQPTICIGESTTLTATSPATTYTWSTGANSNSIVVTPTITTSYSVAGTSAGCNGTGSTTVTVTSSPTVSATSATVCAGQTATLIASGATNYTWTPTGITSATLTDSPGASTTYTVLGATGTCTATAIGSITIGAGISISINSATVCSGQNATLTATSPATTYTWSTGANTNSIVVNPSVTSTYSVAGSNAGCNGVGSTTVTVDPPPALVVNGPTNYCTGQTGTLSASGANTYTWFPDNFVGANFVITPTANITYTVVAQNATGCLSNSVIAITISNSGNISITGTPTLLCVGESSTLTANGVGSYTWLPSGVNSQTLLVTPVSTQDYTVVSSVGSCTATGIITVSVTTPPSVTITPSTMPIVCNSTSVTLHASGSSSYTWNPGNLIGNSIVVSPISTTNYTLLGGVGNCIGQAVQEVTVIPNISVQLSVKSLTVCKGTSTVITASGATNYVWNPGGLSGSSVTITPKQNGNLIVTGSTGNCYGSNTVSIFVSNVTADFEDNSKNTDNFNVVEFYNHSTNNTFNYWYFNNGMVSYDKNPQILFDEPGTYVACLMTKNMNGCTDTLCKAINVGCADGVVFFPNTFTPNEDGVNDVFRAVALPQCILEYKMKIFDRWGEVIFTTTKFDESWKGDFKGQPAKSDVYVYVVDFVMSNRKAYHRTGHITLIK